MVMSKFTLLTDGSEGLLAQFLRIKPRCSLNFLANIIIKHNRMIRRGQQQALRQVEEQKYSI
jgi:hypothetical protein